MVAGHGEVRTAKAFAAVALLFATACSGAQEPIAATAPLAAPVTLSVRAGGFVSVLGPSGCGKSTLLRIAAGLAAPSEGVADRRTDEVAFVFQEPTLMPWRTVRRNVELVGLGGFADHLPAALSGGMRMRAALAQALVMRPLLFLFGAVFVTHSVGEAVYLSTRLVVLSPRPGRVLADLPVRFPRPRDHELRYHPEFAGLAAEVSRLLRGATP